MNTFRMFQPSECFYGIVNIFLWREGWDGNGLHIILTFDKCVVQH